MKLENNRPVVDCTGLYFVSWNFFRPKSMLIAVRMEAFCGKWRLDRESCEGEREFYEAEGSMPDSEMIDKILEAECIVTMAEVRRSSSVT